MFFQIPPLPQPAQSAPTRPDESNCANPDKLIVWIYINEIKQKAYASFEEYYQSDPLKQIEFKDGEIYLYNNYHYSCLDIQFVLQQWPMHHKFSYDDEPLTTSDNPIGPTSKNGDISIGYVNGDHIKHLFFRVLYRGKESSSELHRLDISAVDETSAGGYEKSTKYLIDPKVHDGGPPHLLGRLVATLVIGVVAAVAFGRRALSLRKHRPIFEGIFWAGVFAALTWTVLTLYYTGW